LARTLVVELILFCVVWQAEELLVALLPVWEKIYCQEPEAAPFRIPVEPVAMGIPVRSCYGLHQMH